MKKCCTCKETKEEYQFYKHKQSADGLKYQCKKCHNLCSYASQDKKTRTDRNREWMRKSKYCTRQEVRDKELSRSRVKNKSVEMKARALANRAVELGFLVRPLLCPKCNRSDLKLHAHHTDYSKPLDVEWMCSQCHGNEHRNNKTKHTTP